MVKVFGNFILNCEGIFWIMLFLCGYIGMDLRIKYICLIYVENILFIDWVDIKNWVVRFFNLKLWWSCIRVNSSWVFGFIVFIFFFFFGKIGICCLVKMLYKVIKVECLRLV